MSDSSRQAGFSQPIYKEIECVNVRNRPVVTSERQINIGAESSQPFDAPLRIFHPTEMRLGGGQYCPAGPLDIWFAERPLGRLNRLLQPSKEEAGLRLAHQELSKIGILRAETHRQINVRQRVLWVTAGCKGHTKCVVGLSKTWIKLDRFAKFKHGRV